MAYLGRLVFAANLGLRARSGCPRTQACVRLGSDRSSHSSSLAVNPDFERHADNPGTLRVLFAPRRASRRLAGLIAGLPLVLVSLAVRHPVMMRWSSTRRG